MKRNPMIIQTVKAGGLWALCAWLALPAFAEELLLNGKMEDGEQTPEHWSLGSYKEGAFDLKRDTARFKSAPASLLLETKGPSSGFVQQVLKGEPEGRLKVEGDVFLEGSFSNAEIVMQVFDGAGKQTDWKVPVRLKLENGWQHFSGETDIAQSGRRILFGLVFKGDGKAWLDNLSVQGSSGMALAEAVAPLPVEIKASDPRLRYSGRFEMAEENGALGSWPASTVAIRFRGSDLNARLGLAGGRVQVVVDGKPSGVLQGAAQDDLYRVASGLPPGEHTVSLVKITEPLFGNMRFRGFQVGQGAEVLPSQPSGRRIEVIGDSISAGYGNEASSEKEKFSSKTENAWLAYGAITARNFAADYTCIAWSGKLLWPNNTLTELYGRAIPQKDDSAWDFSKNIPDVVLVNLGTNDFAGGNPQEEGWVKAYLEFLERIRKNYPQATIYCAVGPMLSDPWSPSKNALSTIRGYLKKIVEERNRTGDAKVRFLEFQMQDGKTGFGADWHPSRKTHERMAEEFSAVLEKDLGWKRE